MNDDTFPQVEGDILQSLFERMKLKQWKNQVLRHLKSDPDALPIIQKKCQENLSQCEGVILEFHQWVLNGCKP